MDLLTTVLGILIVTSLGAWDECPKSVPIRWVAMGSYKSDEFLGHFYLFD